MIEVFKTNITNHETAERIKAGLQHLFPSMIVNFDLEDCDKVLRVKCDVIDNHSIIAHLADNGFICEVL